MIALKPQGRTLDLRYNEMWNDWDGSGERQTPKQFAHGQLVLSWKRLNVSVKITTPRFFRPSETVEKRILYNVSGNVQCGCLLGIMGPSGSGKTTLMATISHRTKGNFEGELLLNGQPVSEEMMIKISGFVPQHDINFEQLTAFEHLFLMANLKMDRNTTEETLYEHLEYIVATLGMSKFLETRISFLSGGERKKVALAVQMLNDPPILFCDEITTGLDSYTAAHIMNTLKGIAQSGKIVICTIHQPASGIFGKLDEVILMSNGRLAYQGPVSMVKQMFQKFNYECPNMFNEADFVISILNSESDKVKKDVEKMCELSSTDQKTKLNYDLFNNQAQLNPEQYLQTKQPHWITQFQFILDRSIKCFIRSYSTRLLELATILVLGTIIASPYWDLKLDTKAVQNWQGFWFIFIINFVFHFTYSAVSLYQKTFSIVHREVHNKVYALSAYYLSELMIVIIWLMIKIVLYCYVAFWIIGAEWNRQEFVAFFLVALSAFSYGSLLSSFFSRIETTVVFATIYDFISLSFSGAYLSFKSFPDSLHFLRFFSIFFLGCETVSTLFWEKITYLPCIDMTNCLENGKAVLNKYGYVKDEFYFDLLILSTFSVLANILSYFGVRKKMKKQPAY